VRLGLIIAAVTALKGVAVLLVVGRPTVWEDGRIAINLLQTGTFFLTYYGVENHSFQFPVYALLVAGAFGIFGQNPPVACLLNLLLNGVTAWVLAALFARFTDEMAPALPAVHARTVAVGVSVGAFLLHPLINYYAMTAVHPFTMDMLMFYLPLLLTFRYFDRGERMVDLVILGVALGLALLTRSTLIVSVLLLVMMAAARDPVAALKRLLLVVGIALLVGAPWLIRNYRIDGILGYTSTTSEILWKGALPGSEGSNFLLDGRVYREALTDAEQETLPSLSVQQQSAFFARKYLAIAAESPPHIARMFLVKLRNFFWFRDRIGNTYGAQARRFIPLYQFAYTCVLGLALLSVLAVGRPALHVWALIAALGIIQSVFYVETRHRILVEPLLIFLAAVSSTRGFIVWRRGSAV
jgi:hypothetical protein